MPVSLSSGFRNPLYEVRGFKCKLPERYAPSLRRTYADLNPVIQNYWIFSAGRTPCGVRGSTCFVWDFDGQAYSRIPCGLGA